MPDIVHTIEINASLQRVYDALTSTEGIRRWWTRDASIETQTGGFGEFGFSERTVVTAIRVDELRSAFHVGWTTISSNAPGGWNNPSIAFDLQSEGNVTVLEFAHCGFNEIIEGYTRVGEGWSHYLASLKQYLETGAGTPA